MGKSSCNATTYLCLEHLGLYAPFTSLKIITLGWILCCYLPIAAKISPIADAHRLFLPLHLPFLMCCGMGAATLRHWINERLLSVILLISVGVHLSWIQTLWVHQHEWRIARESLHQLPEGAVLQMDNSSPKWEKKHAVFSWLTHQNHDIQSITGTTGWLWRGPYCNYSQSVPLCLNTAPHPNSNRNR